MFTKEPINDIPCLYNKSNGKVLSDITISHQYIINQLQKLDPNKSCGPDKIHPRVIKELKIVLLFLCFIYTQSLYMKVPYQLVGKMQ